MSTSHIIVLTLLVIFTGLVVIRRLRLGRYDGAFIVDMSDEAKDIYRLEINNLNNITSKKIIILKVKQGGINAK